MNDNDSSDGASVALYWDFENLHASLVEAAFGEGTYGKPDGRFKVQEPLVSVQAVLELAASFGPVAINRAYCNWQYFGRYRDALLQGAVELIQLFPPGASAKNGADIKLCLDAAEDISRFAHIGTVLIVGGDSDYMPVAQKIKAAGRRLVGIGTRRSTNRHWAKSCHEFRYYDSLVAEEAAAPTDAAPAADQPPPTAEQVAAATVERAVKLLAETKGDPWVNKAPIFNMVKRLDPTFDPKEFGHATFSAMLKTLEGSMFETRRGEFDVQLRLKARADPGTPGM
ncbi:NYN domain-containing protein [Aquincola sp. MAHUQ-54]|uniref:NYN domain-containing protein n=1 Tax=Aquincola agrisoli TaxID=3119538 RepID=A0AAW9PZT5_9BURK